MQQHILKRIKETGNNSGWTDPDFQQEMKNHGWAKGFAWCAIFTKYIWDRFNITSTNQKNHKDISINVMQTYNRFKSISTLNPEGLEPGSLVIWQSKKNATSGHIGIYLGSLDNETIVTLEGNTDADGSREGDGIYIKKRIFKNCGFTFKGFIPCSHSEFFTEYIEQNINIKGWKWL